MSDERCTSVATVTWGYCYTSVTTSRYAYCFYNPLKYTDPKAEKYFNVSPYTYCLNSPIMFIDPDGMETEVLRNKAPIYNVNGSFLGTTKEGFTGQILIYEGTENIDFSSLSEDEALSIEDVYFYDMMRSKLTGEAQSNIWTNIVSQMEGVQVYDEVFHLSDIYENKIIYNPNIDASWRSSYALGRGVGKIQGSNKYNYETTVENIQSSIIVHEYYSHIKKNNGDDFKSHRLAYKNVINYKPLWNNTTNAYKGFVVRQLLYFTKKETGRTNVDPLYRYSFNKYKDFR